MSYTIRPAVVADVPLIRQLIAELAVYEKLEHEAVATDADMSRHLFGPAPKAHALIAEDAGGAAAGFALYFFNFSTFLGKPGLYLEDLFVRAAHRGGGLGRRFFAELARIAVAEDCGRMEWWVLDWNAPAIAFYEKLGARAMDEWTVMRIDGDAIARLAAA